MMNMVHFFPSLFVFLFAVAPVFGQSTGVMTGSVRDKATQEVLIGATVRLEGTQLGVQTDVEGNFRLPGIVPRSYNVQVSYLGYQPQTRFNVVVTTGNTAVLNIELEPEAKSLGEVVVAENKSVRIASLETPLSVQNLSAEEIKSNPGGNFDISKVIQVLPGVGGSAATGGGVRNDLVIRGGGPGENVFYLDGVEIPVINHFTTQGASGGPAGILNVSFIEDATLNASAFNARYDNALSSVLQLRQRDGNAEKFQGNVRLSATELALTTEGPLLGNGQTTFLASVRRSYLQFLFEAIGLPIRPNYWDFQYKVTHKFNPKTTLTLLGVGAIDEFTFAGPEDATPENLYVLSSSPSINQWMYTTGATLKRLVEGGYWNLTFSRNTFDNRLDQYEDNYDGQQSDPAKRTLRLESRETENKLRFDYNRYSGNWKWSYGGVVQYVIYDNSTFNRLRPEVRDSAGGLIQPAETVRYASGLDFFRYGAFGQLNRTFFSERLGLSFGVRADGNSLARTGDEVWRTFSPRLSLSYAFAPKWKFNASAGRYFKIPPYLALGYRDEAGRLTNRDLPYTRVDHLVGGVEFVPRGNLRFTAELFFKQYGDYPVTLRDGISLANLGADFGSVGNEPLEGSGKGEAYGLELFAQQKFTRNLFFVGSYTLFRSRFSGRDGALKPSAWDNRHLVSALLGLKFKGNWEVGLKWRYQGGAPYTPYDQEASLRNFATVGRGIFDYAQLSTLRLGGFNQLDLRIDKKWNFRRTTFDLFVDIQNVLGAKNPTVPAFVLKRKADNSGFETTDGQALRPDGANGIPLLLNTEDGSVLPTAGFIFEF